VFVLFFELTLPESAGHQAMDALHHMGRLFAGVEGVQSTRLLRNTEDERVIIIQVTSAHDLIEFVREADITLPNIKTRAWSFKVLETPALLPVA
jgi:heme-degrading monooxygenase HmoA